MLSRDSNRIVINEEHLGKFARSDSEKFVKPAQKLLIVGRQIANLTIVKDRGSLTPLPFEIFSYGINRNRNEWIEKSLSDISVCVTDCSVVIDWVHVDSASSYEAANIYRYS